MASSDALQLEAAPPKIGQSTAELLRFKHFQFDAIH